MKTSWRRKNGLDAGHLAMTGVVQLKSKLHRHQSKPHRPQSLCPNRAYREYEHEAQRPEKDVGRDAERVVPGPLGQQTGVLNAPLQDRVFALVLDIGLTARFRFRKQGCQRYLNHTLLAIA